MRMSLFVDSQEFWESLREDIQSAQQQIYIQTFSFEGDKVGKALAEALLSSPAVDKRIIVDDYARWVISDKYLYFPGNLFNAELRREVRETHRMIAALERRGVKVRFTRPASLLEKFAAHNHKKVVLIDQRIAYIGGINFAEHNFAWHDAMLRIDDVDIAGVLDKDFHMTWSGEIKEISRNCGDIQMNCLGGVSNHELFGRILTLIEAAEEQIYVESPYITFPFLDSLAKAARQGCSVTLITPRANNYPIVREYLLWMCGRANIDVRLYHRMTHLKAMLIDQHYLILGSSNYDYLSYQFHREIVAIITDPAIISDYLTRVFQEDIRNSEPGYRVGNFRGSLINLGMRTCAQVLSRLIRTRSCASPAALKTPSPARARRPVLPKSHQ